MTENLCTGHRMMPLILIALVLGGSVAWGDVTYTLHFDPASSPEAQQVANSVAEAVPVINQYGSFNKHWDVYYDAGIPTAEANYNGYIGCGGTRNTRVIFHEGAHTFGMGTYWAYSGLISGGVWGGQYGNQAQFETFNDYADGLHGDGHAIWPGGFNYDSEDGFIQRIWMLRIMAGIRADMGILSFTREAENELVHIGGTAGFHVESPAADTYQWYKDGSPLQNGGDISGADTDTLRIANAEVSDEGSYYCAAGGAGETLNSRSRQLFVDPEQQLVQLDMDGNVTDSVNTNTGTAYGSPAYTAGKIGQAINLDGANDYITLPAAIGHAKDITVATWVNWDGGNNWQRIFDFGNNTYQYMFLTPKSGDGTLRMAFKDAINGVYSEQYVETSALPTGQWVHLAVVLEGNVVTLYKNGQAAGSAVMPNIDPGDFLPTENYIGKSQFSDPLFNGRIDDFRVYNYALDGSEVWNLWGQSANHAPGFDSDPLLIPAAVVAEGYTGQTLADFAADADLDSLTFTKLDGPDWLAVAVNGALSGIPTDADIDLNSFMVRVQDSSGASSDTELRIQVGYAAGPLAYWDFDDVALGAADGAAVPDSDAYTVWRVAATDKSGYGNHLTTWDHAFAGFNWSTNSQQNDFSIKSTGDYPAAYTWSDQSQPSGSDIENFRGSSFTVEALATVSGSGFRTVLGRDAVNLSSADGGLAALYLGLDNGNHAVFRYLDVDGHTVELASSTTYAADDDVFHHFVGVTDGSTVSLYVDGELEDQATGQSLGGLGIGTTSGSEWHAGGWSVGRGLFAGGHTDRWQGYIDAVAISGVALAPAAFVLNDVSLPDAPVGLVAESGDSQVALAWNTETNATEYAVKVWTASGGPYVVLETVTATNYVYSGLPNGSDFYFVVSAINIEGEGPDSLEVHAVPSVDIEPEEFFIADHMVENGSNFLMRISNSVPGHLYRVLATDTLTPPDWQPAGSELMGDGSNLQLDVAIEPAYSNRYFKLDVMRQ